MQFLHEKNIIHRDLKCENVLLSDSLQARVMDFGLSKIVDDFEKTKTIRIGTPQHMAPEVFIGRKYTEKCDVYSYAILMYCFIVETYTPFGKGSSNSGIDLKVANNPNYRKLIKSLESFTKDEWIGELIKKCWLHDPESRYSFDEIVNIFKTKMKDSGKLNDISINESDVPKVKKNDLESVVSEMKKRMLELERIIKLSKIKEEENMRTIELMKNKEEENMRTIELMKNKEEENSRAIELMKKKEEENSRAIDIMKKREEENIKTIEKLKKREEE